MSSSLREPLSFACWQGYHTGNGNVFAVHGTDAAGVSAILASWEHCGRTGTTNLGCRCTAQDVSGDDWTADEYDDSLAELLKAFRYAFSNSESERISFFLTLIFSNVF